MCPLEVLYLVVIAVTHLWACADCSSTLSSFNSEFVSLSCSTDSCKQIGTLWVLVCQWFGILYPKNIQIREFAGRSNFLCQPFSPFVWWKNTWTLNLKLEIRNPLSTWRITIANTVSTLVVRQDATVRLHEGVIRTPLSAPRSYSKTEINWDLELRIVQTPALVHGQPKSGLPSCLTAWQLSYSHFSTFPAFIFI